MIDAQRTDHVRGTLAHSVWLLALLGLLHFSALPSHAIAVDIDDAVDGLIERLKSPDQATRDAAAEKLRESYAPPSRERWDALLVKTKPGDVKRNIWTRFGVDEKSVESNMGTGQVHMEEVRLDDRWLLRGWFNNADDSLREAQLVERVRPVWVAPGRSFTGVWVAYFVNGRQSHEVHYKDGKYHGRFTSYHGNGSKSFVQHYVDHIAEGEDTGYFPTGEMMYRGVYRAGKQVGVWTWYEKDGSIRTQRDNGSD